jgi:hypothetical protein
VIQDETLNAIDFLEVVDSELQQIDPLRQRTLLVHCFKPLPADISQKNLRLIGGQRIQSIAIEWAAPASPLPATLTAVAEAGVATVVSALPDVANVLVVRVSQAGDFSTYTLRIIASAIDDSPHPSFDPQFNAIDFSFKVASPSDFDCRSQLPSPPPPTETTEINYLVRDYGSLRRMLLDRMAQLVPRWQQTSVADYGVALIELLAFIGDQLNYQQDAIATEAYLGTARRRTSLRRHAVLVDYPMHDGCNARAWLQVEVTADSVTLDAQAQFLTRCPGLLPPLEAHSAALRNALSYDPLVFEPLHTPTLYAAHNRISFYTWGDARCCLPTGATGATLAGAFPDLKVGDPLLLEEVVGARTGQEKDADPGRRHVVRLTSVKGGSDPLTHDSVTEIAWTAEDALPFPLCISAVTDEAHGSTPIADVSVARGNLVLVDHGATIRNEPLGEMLAPSLFVPLASPADPCVGSRLRSIPPRYRPRLRGVPLTHAATALVRPAPGLARKRRAFDPGTPAAVAMQWSMSDVVPQIHLDSSLGEERKYWQATRTLLNSTGESTDFVVEVEDDGSARLRFGDGDYGQRPAAGTVFTATYRVGNGSIGNVGPGSIYHVVGPAEQIGKVRKVYHPLPAEGGLDAESAESVRRNAPEAIRVPERAATIDDYAAMTKRHGGVERAAAAMRWTGSWHTVCLTVDPSDGRDAAALKNDLIDLLDQYRMAGHDLKITDPRYVSLELELEVRVKPEYARGDIEQQLRDVFSDRVLPDGRRAFFHRDNLSFGQSVYVSQIYAAAHAVPGVSMARVVMLKRQHHDDASHVDKGVLPVGRFEIAQLANDPSDPERGVLRLDVIGGR